MIVKLRVGEITLTADVLKEVDFKSLLQRRGIYEIDADAYHQLTKKREYSTKQHLKKFSYNHAEANNDLIDAYKKMEKIYHSKSQIIEALNKYTSYT